MVQSAGGCGAGFLYSIAPKQINGDLGCSWLVGWWGKMGGGNFGGGTPAIFFVWGGNVELYIKLSSEHLAFFFSEWKFVQYGCGVGYFARDSMKTE